MIFNLTPHPLAIYPNDCPDRIEPGQVEPDFVVGASDKPARLVENSLGTWFTDAFDYEGTTPAESLTSIAVEGVEYTYVAELPLPDKFSPHRTFYVVSLVVALAMSRYRDDLLAPYREVRNMSGTVIGCRQLVQPA